MPFLVSGQPDGLPLAKPSRVSKKPEAVEEA